MNQKCQIIPVLATVLTVVGCSRSALLTRNRVEVTKVPTVVKFERPIPGAGALWEMCFEFDRPGDSDEAGGIYAVLITTSGERRPLVDFKLDRRRERQVC